MYVHMLICLPKAKVDTGNHAAQCQSQALKLLCVFAIAVSSLLEKPNIGISPGIVRAYTVGTPHGELFGR